MLKTDYYTTFKCVPLDGTNIKYVARQYEELINQHIHNPVSQYVEEAGRQLYMRPMDYSLERIGEGYVANITLVGTSHGPFNSQITSHHAETN